MKTVPSNRSFELADFEYELPEHLIASQPLQQREKSRLLVLHRKSGVLEHRVFEELPQLLKPTDLLVINNTKVMPVRLKVHNITGANIELLLLKPETSKPGLWEAMASPLKRLKEGEQLTIKANNKEFQLQVVDFRTSYEGQRRVLLDLGSKSQVSELLAEAGLAPLPPYIKKLRTSEERDKDLERYQTVYAREPGAVAAPTAGLHFSTPLMQQLKESSIEIKEVTLHVGPGTFKPVTTTVRDHKVEEESYSISADTAKTINQARNQGRRVITVGTTSCRALESAWTPNGLTTAQDAKTDLYIRPGFKFNVVDGLITNFHLSRSSLLIMVAAFAGLSLIKKAYAEAIQQEYRFYSYGDAMLIL
jgi:S-adenosylmethionine:tRNA ribosyltransferase-isomerase